MNWKRRLQKIAALCLCALLLAAALPVTASAENYGGTFGENDSLRWSFNSIRGVLVISGSGAMEDFDGDFDAPWAGLRMDIAGVKVEDGVTYIGTKAFVKLHCTTVTMADSVQRVGNAAIQTCLYLKLVTFSDGVRTIGSNNVTGCEALETVHVSRFTQEIGSGFMKNSRNAAVICSTSEDCAAKDYADANGITFRLCSHTEHTHAYDAVETTATCTDGGYTTYVCTVCGDSYTDDETPALGHDWEESGRTDATCTADGEIEFTCTRDASHTKTEPIPASGHAYESVVTSPTCTEEGFTTHTCLSCGDSYTDTEVPAMGHEWEETSRVDATCTENGTVTYVCTHDASHTKTEPIQASGHTYEETVTAPTCTEAGFTTHTCTACGDSYTDTPVSVLGHDWQEQSRTQATCTADGEIVYVCTRDASHVRTQTLPAPGHAYTEIVTPPTCTKDGFTTHTCAVCGNSFADTVVSAAEHRYDAVAVAPTCTADGYTTYTCVVCGEHYTDRQTPALGHKTEDGVCVRCGLSEDWEYTVTNGCVTLTGYKADEPFLTLPGTLGGKRVTAIADGAFRDNAALEYVCIPDSVTAIGSEAFFGCAQLREVFVGSGVVSVGYHAFAQCPCLAIVCITAENVDLRSNVFGVNDPRFSCIVPDGSFTASCLQNSALRYGTFAYPQVREGKNVIAFGGRTVLYGDLDYFYWVGLARKYPDAYYMRFEQLVFDGISPDLVKAELDEEFLDRTAEDLTFNGVYVSIQVGDEPITFARLAELLSAGQISLAVSFDSEKGGKLTIFQKIGGMMHKVFNALAKLVNAIVRIFKK